MRPVTLSIPLLVLALSSPAGGPELWQHFGRLPAAQRPRQRDLPGCPGRAISGRLQPAAPGPRDRRAAAGHARRSARRPGATGSEWPHRGHVPGHVQHAHPLAGVHAGLQCRSAALERRDLVPGSSGRSSGRGDEQSERSLLDAVVPEAANRPAIAASQVQVVWFLQANAGPSGPFPQQPQMLQGQLTAIMGILKSAYPNVAMVYAGTRIYAGYATTMLNPEPHAYETGFAFKWMIENQINGQPALNWNPSQGPVQAPWIAWGPYMWGRRAHSAQRRADLGVRGPSTPTARTPRPRAP